MKRRATWGILGFVAVAATLGISLQYGSGRVAPASANNQSTVKPGGTAKLAKKESEEQIACDSISKTLATFLEIKPKEVPKAGYCEPDSKVKPSTQADFKFVVATLPDPVHTHLSLLFDRMIEVVQQAAQDEHFFYQSSWLPWEDQEKSYELLADEDAASDRKNLREAQPGILIFRGDKAGSPSVGCSTQSSETEKNSNRQVLIVFVVGEDPTGGIHPDQFTNAVDWVEKWKVLDCKRSAPTAILGPTFSGSFDSLARLLSAGESKENHSQRRPNATDNWAIYSGTANGGSSIDEFVHAQDALHANFHNFLERDEVGLERFCQFLDHQGTKAASIAVLSEDETAYGERRSGMSGDAAASCLGGELDHSDGALRLYYPRDISALRAAYQTNSIFNATNPEQSSGSGRGRLPTDLADPEGKEHDTVRSYAGNQTPPSQEAFLLGLVDALRFYHSEYVIIRSTNSLDQIFLARYLRHAYPDARIVIDNMDRLFERERDSAGVAGSMSLTTYPLSELARNAVNGRNSGHREFSSDYSEGTYIAFRLLLHSDSLSINDGRADDCALQPQSPQVKWPSNSIKGSVPSLPMKCSLPLPLPDYGVPSWAMPEQCPKSDLDCVASRRPATWLSVLTHEGYWPIAALNEDTLSGENRAYSVGDDKADATAYPLAFKLLLLFLIGFSCFHCWCCTRASFTAKPAFLAHFAGPASIEHTCLVQLGSIFVAFLALIAGWGSGLFESTSAAPLSQWWYVCIGVFLVGMIALLANIQNISRVDLLDRIRQRHEKPDKLPTKRTNMAISILSSVACAIVFSALFVQPISQGLLPANRFLTYYRSMYLFSGASPLVPLAALFFGLYGWFWQSLHGHAVFGEDRCVLPKASDLRVEISPDGPKLDLLPMFSAENCKRIENCAKPLNKEVVSAFAISFAVLLSVIQLLSHEIHLRSLGSQYYADLFLYLLLLCVSWMLAEAWQLLRTWMELRKLLRFLDRLPLRRTLAALRGFSWGSVWKMSGNVLDVRYKLLSRQLECLGHTRAALAEPLAGSARSDVTRGCLDALDATRAQGTEFAKWYARNYSRVDARDFRRLENFQESTAQTAAKLLVRVLIPEWHEEKISLILDDASKPGESDDDRHKAPPLSDKKHIRDAEEFVCLPYLGFIQNILGRMRTIAVSIISLFVATTVAISGYPFDPRQAIGGAMFALFALLGIIILYVYAQMHRDTTISHITNTSPGELGSEFWMKVFGYGVAPLLGLLTTIFPSIADFVYSWLQPGIQAIK